jgi:hypothetical protein
MLSKINQAKSEKPPGSNSRRFSEIIISIAYPFHWNGK